jgi:Caspase domain
VRRRGRAIAAQFAALAQADPDDFVVIGFSGHGSETHELVTSDADVLDLEHTCIPLDELTEWFKARSCGSTPSGTTQPEAAFTCVDVLPIENDSWRFYLLAE